MILRGVPISLEMIGNLEDEHHGKVVLNEMFASYLERILLRKKATNPNLAIKSMNTPSMPGVYYVPVEIELDPFGLGQNFRSGYHLFVECQKLFKGAAVE